MPQELYQTGGLIAEWMDGTEFCSLSLHDLIGALTTPDWYMDIVHPAHRLQY